jgi:hypothetical protein
MHVRPYTLLDTSAGRMDGWMDGWIETCSELSIGSEGIVDSVLPVTPVFVVAFEQA